MFLKVKNSNSNFNLKKRFESFGVKRAVTHFVTHFTHVSRHFGVYCTKQKKYLEKTGLKMLSQMLTKNGVKVHKTTFRKKCKK